MEELADQIGELLRKARENAGLVVDDVVFQTRLPKSVVVALEEGDFSVFSSPTYARSFLSQYSDFLDVDAGMWLDALEPQAYASGDVELLGGGPGLSHRSVVQVAPGGNSGWFAATGLLVVSGAFVFGAVKGYEILEHKLGGVPPAADVADESSSPDIVPTEDAPLAVKPMVAEEQRQTASLPVAGIVEPPPRANVVVEPR